MEVRGAVLVLGMHRSGTSCLIGCLEEAGLGVGDVNREAPHNRKGNNENRKIMVLHDDILAHSGGSWDDPPTEVRWTDDHRRRRDEILGEYQALPTELFGFKDPRTLVVLDGWLEVLTDWRLVGTFRHPSAVAMSLAKRNGFDTEKGMRLWMEYNRILLGCKSSHGIDVVSFDAPQSEYEQRVGAIARRLGLHAPNGGFTFFDPILRNYEPLQTSPVPREALALYQSLQEIASSGASPADVQRPFHHSS